MDDLAGQNLGPYRVLERIGAGGMASVFRAYQPAMDRYVAIKVVPRHLARDPHFRARFQREAHTIARLEHRYILPVYDVGEDDTIPYLVMRYTDSGTLADQLANRVLPLERAVQVIGQVAEALAYAHRNGVIHRDIKPANVLISRDGDALLTDFGIAKIYEDTLQLTSEGTMVGTPAYMAPEQLQGQPVDGRADIYALGVVLYQAATGELPFVAETPLAVAMMHIHNSLRPPRELNPNIPEPIERIILRAMAKNPEDRYQTADDLAKALRDAADELRVRPPTPPPLPLAQQPPATTPQPPPATPQPRPLETVVLRPHLSPIWLVAGGALILALVAGIWLLTRPAPGGVANQGTPSASTPLASTPSEASPSVPTPADATPASGAQPLASLPPGPTVTPRADLSVFSGTSNVYDLVTVADTAWGAATGGLMRYNADGTSRVFTVADGLPFGWIQAILAAPDGTLWVANYDNVAQIRPVADGLGEVTSYDDGLSIGNIYTFMLDSDGSIWVGGYQGIMRFDGQKWSPPLENPLPDGQPPDVRALLRSRDGALWVGLTGGLWRWDGTSWTQFDEARGAGQVGVYRLLQDRAGTLWAATVGKGLLRYDAGQDRWDRAALNPDDDDLRSITQLADGRLWATSNSGIAASSDDGATWAPVAPPEQFQGNAGSARVVEDSAGRIWAADGVGVSVSSGEQWQRIERPAELPMSAIGRIVSTPDGKLWAIEQYGGRAAAIDPASMQVEPPIDLDASVFALAQTNGTSWIGTSAGLVRQRGAATLRLTTADGLPSDEIRGLLATDTTLWIGTTQGLVSYDLAGDTITGRVADFDGGSVAAFLVAPDGAVWAGSFKETEQGLAVLGRYDGTEWQIWNEGETPLPTGVVGVSALGADMQGQIWVGTWGGGLHTWNGTDWKTWTDSDGAPSGNVFAIQQHAGKLWVAGQEGDLYGNLYHWGADGWSGVPIGGLAGITTDMRFTADGALWIATNEGLLRIDPNSAIVKS